MPIDIRYTLFHNWDQGLKLHGAVGEIPNFNCPACLMLTKVVTDLEDLAVIHRSITAMEAKFSELVTRIGDAEKRIESSERELAANPLATKADLQCV